MYLDMFEPSEMHEYKFLTLIAKDIWSDKGLHTNFLIKNVLWKRLNQEAIEVLDKKETLLYKT